MIAGGDWNRGKQVGDWKMLMDYERYWILEPEQAVSYVEFTFGENGNPVSDGVEYNLAGVKIGQSSYAKDRKGILYEHGEAKEFYANGNIKSQGKYDGGLKIEEWNESDQTGKQSGITVYEDGEVKEKLSLADIESRKIKEVKQQIGRDHYGIRTKNQNSTVQYYQYRAPVNKKILFEKALVVHQHYLSQVNDCGDYNCITSIQVKLDNILKRLNELINVDTSGLEVKLKFQTS